MTYQEVIKALVHKDTLVQISGSAKLPDQTFKQVKQALEKIGGKWSTRLQGWTFKVDPAPMIQRLQSGGIVDIYKENQFFYTPWPVLDFITDWPEREIQLELPTSVSSSDTVRFLEPEAGEGHIIKWVQSKYGHLGDKLTIECCETMDRNRQILQQDGYNLIGEDFLDLPASYDHTFDLIIANPPFSRNQYMKHIYKMYDMLKAGGTLIAIAPKGYQSSIDSDAVAFRDFLLSNHAMERDIPMKLFRKNKASVQTVSIWIDILY